jgi:hypothetical protein
MDSVYGRLEVLEKVAGIPERQTGLEIAIYGNKYLHTTPLFSVMIPCFYTKGLLPVQGNLLLAERLAPGWGARRGRQGGGEQALSSPARMRIIAWQQTCLV